MKGKTWLSIIGLAAGAMLVLALLLVTGGTAGEYHVGEQLFCYDCHTMHYSMQHGWDTTHTSPIVPGSTGPAAGGNWLGTPGPNAKLLKAPANDLCKSCHDQQSFAPDVVGDNINATPDWGRSAGALPTGTTPRESWKGHELDSTAQPPGYNPSLVGLSATWYNYAGGLECVSCHSAHGSKPSFRNLGTRSLGSSTTRANFQPTYVIAGSNDTTKDVWINAPGYATGSSSAGTFNPYYATKNISFNKLADGTRVGNLLTSNRLGSFCASCHANFHGGDGDTNVSLGTGLDFIRHPTAGVVVPSRYNTGAAATQPHPGPPVARVRVFGDTTTGSPGCPTCHKSHGNMNPFGLIFLNQLATTVTEEGGLAPTQTGLVTDTGQGLRNLCWQCHGMGATDAGY